MRNALTIDVEDWYHCIFENQAEWAGQEDRIVPSTARLLGLLRETGTKGTFFVLGYVAAMHPELVEAISSEGHEIATHGYYHQFVYKQTPDEFRTDLGRSIRAIQDVTGQLPLGYRAPYFSITRKSMWAFGILADLGFRYDSSVYPVVNHRYGQPKAPRFAYHVNIGAPPHLTEVPISTTRLLGINLPFSGGFYFRLLPYPIVRRAFRRVNGEGQPVLFYAHPWEIDPDQPKPADLNPLFKARRYHNLEGAESKLRVLLSDFEFAPVRDVFERSLNE